MKINLKQKAIFLRKKGLSYSEILGEINVSKSSLSLWLRSIELTNDQKERLKEKRNKSTVSAARKNKQLRIDRTKFLKAEAITEIKTVSQFDLLLMGTMLYWAEGAKQKEHNISQGICFSNSDPHMIKLFIIWLKNCLNIRQEDIYFDIYIHETYQEKKKIEAVASYWAQVTGFPRANFDRIYYKKNKISSNRKNRKYFGLLRVNVRKSTDKNRKITGWIEGIYKQCGIV